MARQIWIVPSQPEGGPSSRTRTHETLLPYPACLAIALLQGLGRRQERMSAPSTVGPAMPAPVSWDVTRILLAVVAIGGLIAATFWVLRPFLPALIWATMIVVATWPAMRAVQRRLWDRRGLAVAVMTVAMLVIVVAPIAVAIVVVFEHASDVAGW